MAYDQWRRESQLNSLLLIERSNEASWYKQKADCYEQVVNEIRSYLIKSMMKKQKVNPKDLLDRIDGV